MMLGRIIIAVVVLGALSMLAYQVVNRLSKGGDFKIAEDTGEEEFALEEEMLEEMA